MVNEVEISIYSTVYNNSRTIVHCVTLLAKVMNELNVNWEFVVTDNYSTDGTYELLVNLSKVYPIRIVRYRCSRGLGRDIALRNTCGKYVMYIDGDVMLSPKTSKLIHFYLENTREDAVYVPFGFANRSLILRIGGWRDLNHGEDTEFFARAALKAKLYHVLIPPLKREQKVVGKTSLTDCQHIAFATIHIVDVLASWNFKHIVNLERIRGYNSINIREGYKIIEIRTPKEIFDYGNNNK